MKFTVLTKRLPCKIFIEILQGGNPCLPAGRSLPIGRTILTGLLRRYVPRNDNFFVGIESLCNKLQ